MKKIDDEGRIFKMNLFSILVFLGTGMIHFFNIKINLVNFVEETKGQ
jgi:hypothetical protein